MAMEIEEAHYSEPRCAASFRRCTLYVRPSSSSFRFRKGTVTRSRPGTGLLELKREKEPISVDVEQRLPTTPALTEGGTFASRGRERSHHQALPWCPGLAPRRRERSQYGDYPTKVKSNNTFLLHNFRDLLLHPSRAVKADFRVKRA